MKRSTKLYLQDILESIELIFKYTEGLSEINFLKTPSTYDAVLRRFEIIGETTRQLSTDFKKDHPEIPWKQASGMRDVMIHGYYMVNPNRVWKTIKVNLPELKEQIHRLLNTL